MSLSYADFDELQDKREQIIEALKNGAMRVSAVGEQVGLKKATLDYHILKLIGCGLIEEKYEGKAAYIGLTAKCREMLRKEPENVKRILQENGRKRKVRPELKIAALSVMFVLILGVGLFFGGRSAQPITQIGPVRFPVLLQFMMTNDFVVPLTNDSLSIGFRTYYPSLGSEIARRQLVILNATVNDTLQYTSVKVYAWTANSTYVIGQLDWNPFIMVRQCPTCSPIPSDPFKLTPYSNGVFVVLDRPLQNGEWISVIMFNGNTAIGEWNGVVY
ncbi:MAG: hypothetical protein UY55_C0005G0042 [Candidatus Jorgensenbacteria bacterium GW2011_GWB1_50_10]|uniref:Uncharacterized protein n=1 Tax=Candidatus Jorgensenbacteria bacterium GW2011_GWB1_50_10 TaxID=1618665 RepID=A0A0G1Z6Z8_9BACT|nr:MAG: hypothetical protein UY55_C0005G0042 [Candidatus Jorgensenbacteria bacterium GW2011_GWB1_50_10]